MQSPNDAATKQFGVEPIAPPETVSGDRWVGRRVGNYIVDRPLARGGMGAVYVARHPQLGREVAVKFLAQNVSAEPEIAARFLSEARVTASLNHPNIVEILDFGELDGELYYVMELLRGKSLRAVMREKGRLSGPAIKPYLEQICWALEAAHAAGIVHRDLKPANVLVLDGEPLRLKLLDFGVAKLLSGGASSPTQTRAGQVLGTATHMAPEQALGDPNRVTPQSDLYALGAIAYEMLTGSPVFHHESDFMLMVMHVRDAVRPIRDHAPDVAAPVAALVEACLAKNPADRPSSARAVAEELAKAVLLAEPTTVAAPARAPERPATPVAFGDQPTHLAPQVPTPPTASTDATLHATPSPVAEPPRQATPKPAPVAEAPRKVTPLPAEVPNAPATLASPVAALGPRKAAPAPLAPVAPVAPAKRQLPGQPVEAPAPANSENTIQLLTTRLQRRGDFPAFARTVGEVSHKADANGAFSAGQLGESILKDYSLTAKLLRIVNATYARRFGGKIYSVQHAIVILGFDRVRSLALSIGLFKTSGTGKDPPRVSESAISALVSGELARNLAGNARVNDDEANICSMFKNLGRHLTLVYLPELFDRVEAMVASDGLSIPASAKLVLGLTFEELGTAIAKSWQLPAQVVNAMSATEPREGELKRSEDRVTALAGFSNELCDIVTREAPAERERAIRNLLVKYKALVSIDQDALAQILADVEASLSDRYAALLGNDLKSSRFVANVAGERAGGLSAVQLGMAKTAASADNAPVAPLAQRIKDVKESLERGQPPDAVLGAALRLLATHLGVGSPLILTLAPNKQNLVVRFGLRDDIEGVRRELKFPMRAGSNNRTPPFAAAYQAGKDLLLKDCFAKEITDLLPACYYEVVGSSALALYACLGRGVTPALVLVDADSAEALPDPALVADLADLRPVIARAAARS